jgi:WW domain-binding protein 11
LRPSSSSTIPGLIVGRPGMPPGPPVMRPGLPPRMLGPRPPMMPPMRSMGPPPAPSGPTQNVPKPGEKKSHFVTERATIEAKPQLRNLSADATRFTPVALRVKRDEKGVKKPTQRSSGNHSYLFDKLYYHCSLLGFESEYNKRTVNPNQSLNAPTKDDAYDQFMKEMSSLL